MNNCTNNTSCGCNSSCNSQNNPFAILILFILLAIIIGGVGCY